MVILMKTWKRFQIAFLGVNLFAAAIGTAVLGKPATKPEHRHQVLEHQYSVRDVAFSPDGKTLVTAGGTLNGPGEARMWDVATGKEQQWFNLGPPSVEAVAYSPDGEKVALGSWDGLIHIYATATRAQVAMWLAHRERVLGLAFAPDGKTLASSGLDQTTSLWDAATGQLIRNFPGSGPVGFSPDGQLLAVSNGKAFSIVLWDLATGQERATLEKQGAWIMQLTFAPDGKTLAATGFDNTASLWDLTTGQLRTSLTGHADRVHCTAFSPDGTLVATGSQDRTIKLWDVATGREIATLEGHAGSINAVAFSPDGKLLASASYDKSVRLWDMSKIN
jgi:WD40 repeat protein